MTLRGSPEWLAAYNAKRGGYAPAETIDITTVDDLKAGRGPQYARGLVRDFSCTIPGVPVAKGRARKGKGKMYTPERTRAAEATVASVVSLFAPPHFAGPVRLELDFFLPVPARMTREQVRQALCGAIRPTGKPDSTNLAKLVEDAIQGHGPGHCFANDSQIVEHVLRKWYSVEPRTMLRVTAL